MKILLILFLAINGQAEPMVRQFEQQSVDQCLSNLNRFMTTKDMIERADVSGIAAMCQVTKAPEKEAGALMPFKSLAQERFFNANRAKLEKQGVNVDEWNSASKGMKLPARAPTGGLMGKALKRKPKRK